MEKYLGVRMGNLSCSESVSSAKNTLVVDLDGTLTPSDTLVESALFFLKSNPLNIFFVLWWLMLGRSELKSRIAEKSGYSPKNLPLRSDLLEWLATEKNQGRRLVLATAANRRIANSVANHLGIFDLVIASDSKNNLKGAAKLAAIQEQVGHDFSYVGDCAADIPIWEQAQTAVLVGASRRTTNTVREIGNIEREFVYSRPNLGDVVKALRLHQWVKNVLLFVPLFTAFEFGDGAKVFATIMGFVAFSLAASGTYLLNDLWDIESDRQHPRKKNRPFASAKLSLAWGGCFAVTLITLALSMAYCFSQSFAAMLMGYVVLTTAYSWFLKKYVIVDVLMLSLLYTFRVLAGSVIADIKVTPWLLAFSVFTFFSLALVKRCAELVSLNAAGKLSAHGRDYNVNDLAVLWPLGVGASLCSVVVFGLYIGSPGAGERYGSANLLWLAGIGLIYWVARLWIKTARGEMHDDPIVFAFRDFGSRLTLLAMAVCVLSAHFIS